jgi:hypothetical protein
MIGLVGCILAAFTKEEDEDGQIERESDREEQREMEARDRVLCCCVSQSNR